MQLVNGTQFLITTCISLFPLLYIDIPLLYYFNLSSSIISCFSSGDIYFCLFIYLSCSFVTVSELFCCEFFETFVIVLEVLLPIKPPAASAAF